MTERTFTDHDVLWNAYAKKASEDMIKWGGVCGWCLTSFLTCGHSPPKVYGIAPRKKLPTNNRYSRRGLSQSQYRRYYQEV